MRWLAVGVAACVLATTDGASAVPVDETIMRPIDALIAGIDTGAASVVASAYVRAPTVTDEFTPFTWTGPAAARRWYTDFERMAITDRLHALHVVRGKPTFVVVDANRAWVVVPATFDYRTAGKSQRETAAWTFALERIAGRWRIATSTWAKTSDTAS